ASQLDVTTRDLEVQKATLTSATASLGLAQAEFDRSQKLYERKVIADADMDQARSRLDEARGAEAAARAAVARAQASIRATRNDLQHMEIVAPFDGVVAQRLVEVGESVIPGQPVIEIVSLADLYVSASIDEVDTGRLRQGLLARVTLDPFRGVEWKGT